jgi:uncharacterized protein (TIGR02145 family)
MKKTLSILLLSTVVFFAVSSVAADKVVIIPLNSNSASGGDGQIQYNDGGSEAASGIYYRKTTGNVGIGNSSPSEALDVSGNVKANSFIGDGSSLTGVVTSETDPTVNALSKATLSCSTDQVAKWNGTAWACAADVKPNQLCTYPPYVMIGVDSSGGIICKPPEHYGNVVARTIGTDTYYWLDRNLGASQVAIGFTDSLAYGDLYQWGRLADGHEDRASGTTSTNSTEDVPGHGNFILESSYPFDWRSPQSDALWQGVTGINNPCPAGFRLPTNTEWETERTAWGSEDGNSNDAFGAFASPLNLVLAGSRNQGSGSLDYVGSEGIYWSSTLNSTQALHLFFHRNQANMDTYLRASGFSVRCLKD